MKTRKIVPTVTLMLLVSVATQATESLKLTSTAFADSESLPVQFTCEGESISPPLSWTGVPGGTESLVVLMDHSPDEKPTKKKSDKDASTRSDNKPVPPPPSKMKKPEGLRWYWSMYNISPKTSGIAIGQSVGTLGSNVVDNKNEYSPPCSKGPGPKNYTFHLYALSQSLDMTQFEHVSEANLRKNMIGLILDSDSLTVSFERSCQSPPKLDLKQNNQHEEKLKPRATQQLTILPLCDLT